jgi:hypothetical protein
MLAIHRKKLDMFLRIRDFFKSNAADFPAETVGSEQFAALLVLVARIERLSAETFSAMGKVGQAVNIKSDARKQLNDLLLDISAIAASMAYDINGLERKFRMPRNRGVPGLIAAGRAFAADAVAYQAEFVRCGLGQDFINELTAATDRLETALNQTGDHTQERIGKNASLEPLFREAMVKVKRLQPIVRMKYRQDAAKLSAWIYASHLERDLRAERPKVAA